MYDIHLEPWEEISDQAREWLPILEARKFPEIPVNPEIGKFYRLYPEGTLSGRGDRFHGSLRLGKETDKVLIFFNGGGVSWSEYTAARPQSLFTMHQPVKHYFNELEWTGDNPLDEGIGAIREDNPFKDWTIINIPYSTGDFHCGAGDFSYTALDNSQRTLPHHGYLNTMALISMAKKWVINPKTILIGGSSAGGFGVSLMAEDIINEFPQCEDITCLVDSSLLLKEDWKRVAKEVWHSPEHIYSRLNGDNISLDSFTALYQKYGDKIKYLFVSSTRDALLAMTQNALDGHGLTYDRESGIRYQRDLAKMCNQLIEQIPTIGLYIFKSPTDNPEFDEVELTQHCVLYYSHFLDHYEEGKSTCDWIVNALEGSIERIGLEHLKFDTI